MLGAWGGNSEFDSIFLVIFCTMALVWIAATLFTRSIPRSVGLTCGTLAILGLAGVVVYWYCRYPPRDGFDGASRLLFLVPLGSLNLVTAIVFFARMLRKNKPAAEREPSPARVPSSGQGGSTMPKS